MRVARTLAGPVGVLLVVLGVDACGGSGYQFVQNEDLGVYAKVPDGWTIYDETDLFPDDSDTRRERRQASAWLRTFDGSDDPSAEGSMAPGSTEPTGAVQVRRLSPEEREQINLSALRGVGDPTRDPLAASEQDPAVEVLLDEPITFDGGFHGVHTVFAISAGAGSEAVLTDRTILLDSTSSTMFLFQIGCEEQCFLETHKDEIAEIVDSWTVQEGE